MKIKVSLVDDHPVVIKGLQAILADYKHIQMLDACFDARTILVKLEKRPPDVLLLDVQLPDKPGDELAQIISKTYTDISIIALTNLDQVYNVRNMFLNGVYGYLLKSSEPQMLIEAIETVYRKEQFIDPVLKDQMVTEIVDAGNSRALVPALTQREQEILRLIAAELTSHEIARKLFLSHRTIESHRLNLLLKLGVKNTAGLVRKAIQLKILR